MEALFDKAQQLWETWGPNLVKAVLVLVIGWVVARIVRSAVRGLMIRAKVDETLTRFCASLLYMLLMALVVISALSKMGVDTTSFAALIAAAGLAIGFALQGSLGNFAAGVMPNVMLIELSLWGDES